VAGSVGASQPGFQCRRRAQGAMSSIFQGSALAFEEQRLRLDGPFFSPLHHIGGGFLQNGS